MTPLAAPDGGRSVFWACALACFLGLAVALGARALALSQSDAAERAGGRITVRVLAPEDPGALVRAEEAIRALPGVLAAEAMTPERAAALVARWGGEIAPDDLVGLRLIEAELEPDGGLTPDLLVIRLGEVGFEVEAAAAGEAVAQERRAAAEAVDAANRAALVVAAMLALLIALMARARAVARADYVILLADLGADRSQAANAYGGEAAISGFTAGVLGAALAALAAFVAAPLLIDGFDARRFVDGPFALAPFALAPLAAGLAAAIGARSGAMKAFDQAVRR